MPTFRMSWMRRISMLCASVFALSVMLPSVMTTSAQTAGDSYTAEMGNLEIAWGGTWEIDDDLTVTEDDLEAVFLSQELVVLTVAILPTGTDPVQTRDAMVQGFQSEDGIEVETIEAGTDDNLAYELDRAEIGGEEMGVFTLIADRGPGTGTVALMIVAPSETFDADLTSAKGYITLDEAPIFEGIDPAGLEDLLDAPLQ